MSNKREREKRREERLQEETKVDARRSAHAPAAVRRRSGLPGAGRGGGADRRQLGRQRWRRRGQSGRKSARSTRWSAACPQNAHGPRQTRGQGRTDRVRGPAVPGLQSLFGRNPAAGDRKQGRQRRSEDHLPELHDHRRTVGPAGAAALAAGEQGAGWNYLELFYRNQGEENSGYATDEFLTAVAKAAGVKNIATWKRNARAPN